MDPRPTALTSAPHELAFCITIYFAQLLLQAGLANVLFVTHIIGPTLGESSIAQLAWLVAAYSMSVGAFTLITGKLGDIYGHKRIFVLGFLWFGICSLLLGFASYANSMYFDIFRALQGIGPAATLPNALALIARTYPSGKRKTMVFALFGATAPLGAVMGALFGSLFAQLLWWPWAMWAMACACFIVACSAQFFVIPAEVSKPIQPNAKIDWIGAIVVVTGLMLFLYAWIEAPLAGWERWYVYVMLIIGALLLVLFFIIEAKVEAPIMPLDIWTQPGFPGVIICIALGWGSFGVWIFYAVQLIQVYRGDTALSTCAQFSPVIISGLCATLLMSFLHSRMRGQYILALALCCFCIGNIFVAICTQTAPYWAFVFPAMCITPFGMDMSYPAAALIVSNALPKERQGVGMSMINTVVNLGISLGLGMAGTVEQQVTSRGAVAWRGQQSATYVGIALSAMGILVALLFCRVPHHPSAPREEEGDTHPKIAVSDL